MEQRIIAHLCYRKRKVGASWNEGYEVLFILEITKGAKQASRSDVGHVYHLSTDVGGLSVSSNDDWLSLKYSVSESTSLEALAIRHFSSSIFSSSSSSLSLQDPPINAL
ncbi:hypothetical protein Tco_1258729 [Tanacetum coccineum]